MNKKEKKSLIVLVQNIDRLGVIRDTIEKAHNSRSIVNSEIKEHYLTYVTQIVNKHTVGVAEKNLLVSSTYEVAYTLAAQTYEKMNFNINELPHIITTTIENLRS